MITKAKIAVLALQLRLRPRQVRWAAAIVQTCYRVDYWPRLDERQRAADIALAVCLVETNLTMYANGNNPESLRRPHEAVGWDHGSVGLFQQQVGGAPNSTANWGTTEQCMDVGYSTRHFLRRLRSCDWSNSNGVLAQAVQGSAFPDRYAKRDDQAIRIRRTLWPYVTGPVSVPTPKPPKVTPKPVHNPKAGKVITVRKGDDFGKIAKRYKVSRAELLAANPKAGHPAGHRDIIWPGDHLRLPG